MRERWETSDSRVVQGIQNMHESWSRESDTALAMKEIRCEALSCQPPHSQPTLGCPNHCHKLGTHRGLSSAGCWSEAEVGNRSLVY
jgi:hypothetical protein